MAVCSQSSKEESVALGFLNSVIEKKKQEGLWVGGV